MSPPDKPLKEGKLHIKQNKFGKKWKRCYVLLYPDSSFGVARLEFYDWKDGTVGSEKILTRKATDRKVIRLAECIHVAPASTGNGYKDNMAAFIIETSEKTMLLSAERATCDEWVQNLIEVAFPGNLNGTKPGQETPLEMAVNSIYVSREEVSEFRVTVQRTEAAERCSLRGSYFLQASSDCLILKDANTKELLYSWPYTLLRRYGRDKVMFSFEAGRRCTSGEGNFTFETSQGHEIFQIVESSIRAHQGSENRLSCPNLDVETDSASQGSSSDSGWCDQQAETPLPRKDLEDKTLKGRALPNLPVVKAAPPQHLLDPSLPGKSSTPPRSPVSLPTTVNEHLSVYSEPKDSVRGVDPYFDPLYSDPVDSVCRKDSRSNKEGVSSPLYSDMYETVAYEVEGSIILKNPVMASAARRRVEHIYDEPEGILPTNDTPRLYEEVRMEGEAWKKQANDEKVGHEYPYNPNTDDYSVPNFKVNRSQARIRPGPKPVPAPKPQGLAKLPGKERDTEKAHSAVTPSNSNNSNNSCIAIEALYSQVVKPANAKNSKPQSTPHLSYDNQSPPASLLNTTNPPQPASSQPPTQQPPPLPPMNKLQSTPPLPRTTPSGPTLPPANKAKATTLPHGSKPLTPPIKPKSPTGKLNPLKPQAMTLPPSKSQTETKTLTEHHVESDSETGVPSMRDSTIIYEDMGLL
ncbi:docking protein 1 [Gastrophryne carolinensis]